MKELLEALLSSIRSNLQETGDVFKDLFFKIFPQKYQRDYFKSVLKHKWYVFLAGIETSAPIWNLIIHDWSKFTPSEFNAYAEFFFKNNEGMTLDETKKFRNEHPELTDPEIRFAFLQAWLYHQRRNPHHWQFWILMQDEDPTMALKIPEKYVREMVADWAGAGRAYTGKWVVQEWYQKNKSKIQLHPESRILVEQILSEFEMAE